MFNIRQRDVFSGFLLSILSFSFFIEYRIGNIWYRHNDSGKKRFYPLGLIHYLINPLKNRTLWKMDFWLDNFIIYNCITWLPFTLLSSFW